MLYLKKKKINKRNLVCTFQKWNYYDISVYSFLIFFTLSKALELEAMLPGLFGKGTATGIGNLSCRYWLK